MKAKKAFDKPALGRRFLFGHHALRRRIPKITTIMMAASAGVYIALRISSLWRPDFWGDELFNYSLSQGPWIALFKRAGLDMAHPPLFYVLLKLWIYLAGNSMFWLRVCTVAISIAAIVPLFILGRELLFRNREIVLALSLMAVNGYLILYSYYLRSYSLLFFLTLCSNVAFVRFLRRGESDKKRTLILLVLINVLFVYTHYFAWLVVVSQYLWVAFMDRRQLRRITVATVIVALCFLPWVGVVAYVSTQVSYTFWDQVSWYQPPSIRSLVLLLRCFNGGFESVRLTLAGSSIFMLLAILPLKYLVSRSKSPAEQDEEASLKPHALLAWLSAFPIVTSLIVSYTFTWIWEPRYVMVSIGPYLLLVASSAFRLRTQQARAVAVVFLLGWASVAGFTGNLPYILHGPNAPSYSLAQDLSRAETRTAGPIRIYGLSPYAEQGLRLAISMTGERRFETVSCQVDAPLPDNYFWIALTEHDPLAIARVKELNSDPGYSLGEPIYSGIAPQRHMLINVRRR